MKVEENTWPRYKTTEIDGFTRTLERLALKIAQAAAKENKKYLFSGGWAIEFSCGEISRNHHDIDFHPVSADLQWWIDWFSILGYGVKAKSHNEAAAHYEVRGNNDELLVDLCPLGAKYLETSRQEVVYKKTTVHIKDPAKVLEYKVEFARKHRGGKLRIQDLHDFKILGETPPQE